MNSTKQQVFKVLLTQEQQLESENTILTNLTQSLTHLSVGGRSPQLILPLLMVGLPLAPGLAALMPVVPGNT